MPAITSWRTRTNASSPGCASSSPSIRSHDGTCHSERSEESSLQASEALHFVQGDNRETILTMAALTSQTETRADSALLNIAAHLPLLADRSPDRPAVIHPHVGVHLTVRQLNEECDRYAWGLSRRGVGRGTRTLLMVKPGRGFPAPRHVPATSLRSSSPPAAQEPPKASCTSTACSPRRSANCVTSTASKKARWTWLPFRSSPSSASRWA